MASQFYLDRVDRPFPVTLLLVEAVFSLMAEIGEGESPTVLDLLTLALEKVRALDREPTEADLIYLATRLEELGPKEEEVPPKAGAKDGKKTFGSDYLEWVTKLDHQGLCFHAADYRLDRARRLYCEEDFATVLELARQKCDYEWQERVGFFEACLFGFGGHYEGGGKNDTVFDMKADRAAAEQSLRSLGF